MESNADMTLAENNFFDAFSGKLRRTANAEALMKRICGSVVQ